MRNFYNQKENIVSEALDGVVSVSGGKLQRFEAASHARVVLRADWDKSKVAIISGGGSGHEPAHAGLVGKSLLTAAVCGEVFASPSVDAVLSAILAATGPAGCLLVVKNYTGDRLNFGLAAEKAKSLGLNVEMIIVADDVAIPDAAQPRGLAGTVFIHKIAGHMSEAGRSLAEIVAAVEEAKNGIFTISAARGTCTLPGSEKQERIGDDEVEIGLGIHGEPGIELARMSSSAELVETLVGRLEAQIPSDGKFALLFNNLGGLSGLECSVLLADLMKTSLAGRLKYVAGPDRVMTALDMPGFSISLFALSAQFEEILCAPTGCAALPGFMPVISSDPVSPPQLASADYTPSRNEQVRTVIETIVDTCIAMESDIDALDAKVGDGDTGSTFSSAARAVRASMDGLPLDDGAPLLSALGDIMRKAMGGSSGVLMAILLARSAEIYRERTDWAAALLAGLDAMQAYGGAKPGDRTMIDAMRPALEALVQGADMTVAAEQARRGADGTGAMHRAGAGRSSYLDARSLDGVNDPGAEAMARIFEELAGRAPL